jgi:hypothetical protein
MGDAQLSFDLDYRHKVEPLNLISTACYGWPDCEGIPGFEYMIHSFSITQIFAIYKDKVDLGRRHPLSIDKLMYGLARLKINRYRVSN